MFLVYGGVEELSVKVNIDVIFQTDRDDSPSQPGFVFLLHGGETTMSSSKQNIVMDHGCRLSILNLMKLQRRLYGWRRSSWILVLFKASMIMLRYSVTMRVQSP